VPIKKYSFGTNFVVMARGNKREGQTLAKQGMGPHHSLWLYNYL
jgi:hypothetical protein